MLDKLSLSNFKTHKDTVLEFSPGINVITGDSGHGKTNILWALNWVLNDRPRGKGYIRRGQNGAIVSCDVQDNDVKSSVTRTRNKHENSYVIEQNGVKQDPLTTFGKDTLALVSSVLDMTDINVQKQRNQHFLVYSPPGQVAAFIRSITKLDEIDEVSKIIASDIRTEKNEIAHQNIKLENVTKKLEAIDVINLDQLAIKIEKAKALTLKIERVKKKKEKIENIVKVLKILEANQIYIPDDVHLLFNKFERYSETAAELFKRKNKLRTLLDNLMECEKNQIHIPEDVNLLFDKAEKYSKLMVELSKHKVKLEDLLIKIKELEASDIILPENLEVVSTAKDTLQKYIDTEKKIETIFDLFEDIKEVESKISNSSASSVKVEAEKRELEEQLEECPECGTTLTEESKKTLLGR
jgi:exonuclease SbcC